MSATEYLIEYQIQRRQEGEDDFTEIGFGSSGAWSDIDAAEFSMGSAIQSRSWETEPGQPEPEEVDQ